MTTEVSTFKRVVCGFSGILAGAGIILGIAAVVGIIAGTLWLLSLFPVIVWKTLAYVVGGILILCMLFVVGMAILEAPSTLRSWSRDRQRRKERLAREARERAERLAKMGPPEPKPPFMTRVMNFMLAIPGVVVIIGERLADVWAEMRSDMADVQMPPARKVLMVAAVIVAELLLLYVLAVINNSTFVPTEKIPNPSPIGVLMVGFGCLQGIFTALTVSVWNQLDRRMLPTLCQRILAAASAVFLPMYGAIGMEAFAGNAVPMWLSNLSGLMTGGMIMTFVLGYVYTCEKNIFEMLKGDDTGDGMAQT